MAVRMRAKTVLALAALCATTMSVTMSVIVDGSSRASVASTTPITPITPLSPARVLDTRPGASTIDGVGSGGGPLGPAGTITVTVAGRAGVPASGASAIFVNVTAVGPTTTGFATVWPTGESRPNASNLNWTAGTTIANFASVKLGAGGSVSIFNSDGQTNFIIDVVGWADPSVFTPVSPARVLDTRAGGRTIDGVAAGQGSIGPGVTLELTVAGRAGVPPSGVSAVALNVTAAVPSAPGYTTVWPTGSPQPNASNLNWVPGDTTANSVTVSVGTAGKVSIFNSSGSTHYIVDLAGWYAPDASFTPLVPARVVDTRVGGTTVDGLERATGALSPTQGAQFRIAGRGGVPEVGVSAVFVNITAVEPSDGGYATVWPTGEALPNSSNLNLQAGRTTPNLVLAKLGSGGRLSIFNADSFTNYIVDVVGWIAGPTPIDVPITVGGIPSKVSANGMGSCALVATASVWCWGSSRITGGIGSWTPVMIPGLAGTDRIANGYGFACASSPVHVKCWGDNPDGRLGDGTTTDSAMPVTVQGITDPLDIGLGFGHACALLRDKSVRCWGDNSYGQLGINATSPAYSSTPLPVAGLDGADSIFVGPLTTCAVRYGMQPWGWGHSIRCWGYLPLNLPNAPGFYRAAGAVRMFEPWGGSVAIGLGHLCMKPYDNGASVWCVGANDQGQLGYAGGVDSFRPVTTNIDLWGIVAGAFHTCGGPGDGSVRCWGGNSVGQLGDGTFVDRPRPVPVQGLGGQSPQLFSVGYGHSCTTTFTGAVYCWGLGVYGQLGNGTSFVSPLAKRVSLFQPFQLPSPPNSSSMTPDLRDDAAHSLTGSARRGFPDLERLVPGIGMTSFAPPG